MLIEKLQAAIKESHDPLLKECLNEIIRLNKIISQDKGLPYMPKFETAEQVQDWIDKQDK